MLEVVGTWLLGQSGNWLVKRLLDQLTKFGSAAIDRHKVVEATQTAISSGIQNAIELEPSLGPDLLTDTFSEDVLGPVIDAWLIASDQSTPEQLLSLFEKRFVVRFAKDEDDPFSRIYRIPRDRALAAMKRFFEALEKAFREDKILRLLAETRAVFDAADRTRAIEEKIDRMLDFVGSSTISVSAPTSFHLPRYDNEQLVAISADLLNWPTDINGSRISRPEFQVVLTALKTASEPGKPRKTIVLFGPPGSGKSALLAAIGGDLRAQGDTVVGIKADTVPETVSTVADLGKSLGFVNDIVDEIVAQATKGPLYLLIDQLDAVAALIDGSGARLRVVTQLVRFLRHIPNIRIAASVRPFEFKSDSYFRTAFPENDVTKVELKLPERDQVNKVLVANGIDPKTVPSALEEIIRTPQALKDIVTARLNGCPWDVITSWRAAQVERLERLIAANPNFPISETIREVIEAQRATGSLWIPEAMLTVGRRQAVDRLCAADILQRRVDLQSIGFSHQTWAQTLDARLALAEGDMKSRIIGWQNNLLARPHVLALLTYARDVAPADYDATVTDIWAYASLRRHIRHLLIDIIAASDTPTAAEKTIIINLVHGNDDVLARRALRMAGGKAAWWSNLRPIIEERMAQETASAWVVWPYLADAAVVAPEEVIEVIKRHWADRADMDRGTIFVLEKLPIWNESAFALFEHLLARQIDLDLFISYLIRKNAEAGRHEVAAKLLGVFWDRLLEIARIKASSAEKSVPVAAQNEASDDSSEELAQAIVEQLQATKRSEAHQFSDLLREVHGFHEFGAIVAKAPRPYAETLLARISALGEKYGESEHELGRRVYRRLSGELGDLPDEDAADSKKRPHFNNNLIEATRVALGHLSVEAPDEFSSLAARFESSPYDLVQRLLALGFSANPEQLHSKALDFVLGDERRFELGTWEDSEAETIILLRCLSPSLNTQQISRLVTAIRTWTPHSVDPQDNDTDARIRKHRRRYNRAVRLRLLRAIEPSKLPKEVVRFIDEEFRGIGEPDEIVTSRMRGGWVGSPMSADQMQKATDAQIIKLFEPLTDATGTDHPSRRRELIGGSVQASRELGELAKRDPERTLQLIKKFSPQTHQRPVGEILRAVAQSDTFDPKRALVEIADSIKQGFGNKESQWYFSNALEVLARRLHGLDDYWIDLLASWLEEWKPPENQKTAKKIYSQRRSQATEEAIPLSLLFHGPISRALPSGNFPVLDAITLGLLCRKPPEFDRWVAILEKHLDSDENPDVWGALTWRLVDLRCVDEPRVSNFLQRLFERFPEVRDSEDGVRLVAQLLWRLSDAVVRIVVDAWEKLSWRLAPLAIGEIVALRAALMPADDEMVNRLESYLQTVGQMKNDDRLVGVANVAIEFWNEDDSRLATWADRVLLTLIPNAEGRLAEAIGRIFSRAKVMPKNDRTRSLLAAIGKRPEILQEVSDVFTDDRLAELIEDPTFHEPVIDFIERLIHADRPQLSDHRTSRPMLARALVPLVLSIHREPMIRNRSIDVFELLLDVTPETAEEVLRGTT